MIGKHNFHSRGYVKRHFNAQLRLQTNQTEVSLQWENEPAGDIPSIPMIESTTSTLSIGSYGLWALDVGNYLWCDINGTLKHIMLLAHPATDLIFLSIPTGLNGMNRERTWLYWKVLRFLKAYSFLFFSSRFYYIQISCKQFLTRIEQNRRKKWNIFHYWKAQVVISGIPDIMRELWNIPYNIRGHTRALDRFLVRRIDGFCGNQFCGMTKVLPTTMWKLMNGTTYFIQRQSNYMLVSP